MHGKASKAVRAAALVLLAATLFSACGRQTDIATTTMGATTATTIAPHIPDRNIKIGIQRDPGPQTYFEVLNAFPTLEAPDEFSTYDLRWRDVSGIDLSAHMDALDKLKFDSDTIWPQTLPEGFDPSALLENGKNPGLGVRALHERGIDGRGISIGIIDTTLLTTHEEYADRLVHYEEIPMMEYPAARHGAAVTSLALGKTCGIAPAAKLYFIAAEATPDTPEYNETFVHVAEGIHRLLDINLQLPENEKIRVISISNGWDQGYPGYDEVVEAVERAKQEGVFVVSASMYDDYGYMLLGAQRTPMADPDDASHYDICTYYKERISNWEPVMLEQCIFAPQDDRTYASFLGNQDYAYGHYGGQSWGIPYMAGLYALCCQVKPDITPDEFWQAVTETAYEQQVQNGAVQQPIRIVNPTELLAKVEGR